MSASCPHCGAAVGEADEFCEACGQTLGSGASPAGAGAPAGDAAPAVELGTQLLEPPANSISTAATVASAGPRHCECGGEIDADGWCNLCGMRAASERDHYTDQPAPHVAAVCDRGVQHPRNEDAVALGIGNHSTVVVVCDGVTNATDSDAAAVAAVTAARDSLQRAAGGPPDLTTRVEHWRTQLRDAARAAQNAAAEVGSPDRIGNVANPPSCTFVAAVIDEPLVASAWIGDSRSYWFPDDGTAIQLSVDDSWASGEIADGVARAVAEADPRAHSITRWLGVDSPGGDPSYTSIVASGPGWLVVCSDGLWNYCSDAGALRDLTLEKLSQFPDDPLGAAGALVDWANQQGGHDNITVALARVFRVRLGAAVTIRSRIGPSRTGNKEYVMATWKADVFENEYLAADATDVHAIVSVECSDAGTAGQSGAAAEIIVVDTSGSMATPHSKIVAAREAAAAAIDAISDNTYFAVIAGNHQARLVYPPTSGMVPANEQTRGEAREAVRHLDTSGGTAIGRWLMAAISEFQSVEATQRHAILLTDGRDETETPHDLQNAIAAATGVFQCDCRGVGADWVVNELRGISSALLGSVDIIAEPKEMADDFRQMMQAAMGRGVADARLRVWAPQGAQVLFVRQVAPTIEDLTTRSTQVTDLIRDFPTGSWGDEQRDYHVAVRVPAKPLGSEQLAARVQLMVGDDVVAQGLVRATWSDDSTLTTRINPAVAHYTGQAELADAIQEGLAAKAAGDDATATLKLGRAAKLAAETGNEEATNKLKRVVEIADADTGTVRLKRDVSKLDEMALDTSSTKTTRVK